MAMEEKRRRNLIFFYHKSHNDRFNGTSVYDKAMLDALKKDYKVITVEPVLLDAPTKREHKNTHYFVSLVRRVYLRQLRWLMNILRGRHLTPPDNTIFLVEDIYCAPIPLIVSKLKGYKIVFRAADFGSAYSRSLFENNPLDRFLYSVFRNLMERVMVRSSSLVICPSRSVELSLTSRFPDAVNKTALLPYVRTRISSNKHNKSMNEGLTLDEKKVVLLFMGDFRYPPNYYAGRYVIDELVPNLNGRSGDYVVLIVGSNSQQLLSSKAQNIKILGAVSDIDQILSKTDIGLAPMKTIGGLSMKVVDYLTHGLTVVATPEAASGIEAGDQMRLAPLSEFHTAVEKEISRVMSNGHELQKISDEVAKMFMTDKWEKKLVKQMQDIKLGKDN